MIEDPRGDALKALEAMDTDRTLDPTAWTVLRVDGRAFSSFTRSDVEKPFDLRMAAAMRAVAVALVQEFNSPLAYQQSDEVSVFMPPCTPPRAMPFGGRAFKISTIGASMAGTAFTLAAHPVWPAKFDGKTPAFDARVFSAPDADTAAEALKWRMRDASRNAILQAGRALFTPERLHRVGAGDIRKMVEQQIGVAFDEAYPSDFRNGVLIGRVTRERDLTEDELSRIAPRWRPTGPVARSEIASVTPADAFSLIEGWAASVEQEQRQDA